MICCHFKSICNRTSIVTDDAYFQTLEARMHACINRTCSSEARKSPEPGPVVIRAGNHLALQREEPTAAAAIHAIVEQIIRAESNGDSNAKNRRSTAMGLGQFLDETWLDMIRAHRPDLAKAHSQAEILELRRDAKIAREITARFAERNAEVLKRRGLPVTAGTLYLAHFAGAAGAVAILSATENADAALVMATADATGRTKREKIVKANPFLERFTVADLRNWADRKMQVPGF
jgi:hypothetical protein